MDRTRGTLFHEIIDILRRHTPRLVILENVGNFERHNGGRTWEIVRSSLERLGYDVRGTVHIASKGHGLISPHHFGYPHTRERFFILGSLEPLPGDPFPAGDRKCSSTLRDIVQAKSELSSVDRVETALTAQQLECIEHWNALVRRIPQRVALPSFPIWGDEIGAEYPFEAATPYGVPAYKLRHLVAQAGLPNRPLKRELLGVLPAYATRHEEQFPSWKVDFIRQNRAWFRDIAAYIPRDWVSTLRSFPASLRKLEWNCQGERRDLWEHVLQFRPSGLRAKRYSSSPALVAMTTTQVPILGPKRRFLTRVEGLRLQDFPDAHRLPSSRARAFAALGNAVHVGLVRLIALSLLHGVGSRATKAREEWRHHA